MSSSASQSPRPLSGEFDGASRGGPVPVPGLVRSSTAPASSNGSAGGGLASRPRSLLAPEDAFYAASPPRRSAGFDFDGAGVGSGSDSRPRRPRLGHGSKDASGTGGGRSRSRRRKKRWKKLLWVNQSYPDNYTDQATFLENLQRNPRLQPYAFWPLVADSTVIVQHVCSVIVFIVCFVGIFQERVSPVAVVGWGSLLTSAGWLLWDLWTSREERELAAAAAAEAAVWDAPPAHKSGSRSRLRGDGQVAMTGGGGSSMAGQQPQHRRGSSRHSRLKRDRSSVSINGGSVNGAGSSNPSTHANPSAASSSTNLHFHQSGLHHLTSATAPEPGPGPLRPGHSHSASASSIQSAVSASLPSPALGPVGGDGARSRDGNSRADATSRQQSSAAKAASNGGATMATTARIGRSKRSYSILPSTPTAPPSRMQLRLGTIKSAVLIYFTLLGLSPILKSLTRSTSSDSIWAMSFWLLAINIFFFDYSTGTADSPYSSSGGAIGDSSSHPPSKSPSSPSSASSSSPHLSSYASQQQQQQQHASSSSSSGARPPNRRPQPRGHFPASLSTNAALMASTVLASRLPSTGQVFSLTLFSIEVFGLFPAFRRRARRASWRAHVALTAALVVGAGGGVGLVLSPPPGEQAAAAAEAGFPWKNGLVGVVVGALACALAVGGCSWWLISLQKYKNEIYGPWDQARPVIMSRRHWDED